jgi:SAM-dependent methyltransferase
VGDFIHKNSIKSVFDLGCGEGALLSYLVGEPVIEKIVGIDLREERLEFAKNRLMPKEDDFLFLRENPLSIHLFAGDICCNYCEPELVEDVELITCMEVIEHLNPQYLDSFSNTIFGVYKKKFVIISTPNAEFNVLFNPPLKGFRDWDHKFEWNRKEFEEWAHWVCAKYGYSVEFSGTGIYNNNLDENIGFCTQVGFFTRNTERREEEEKSKQYLGSPFYSVEYPWFNREVGEQEIKSILTEAINTVSKWKNGDNSMKSQTICIDDLWKILKVRQICRGRREKVNELIREVGINFRVN